MGSTSGKQTQKKLLKKKAKKIHLKALLCTCSLAPASELFFLIYISQFLPSFGPQIIHSKRSHGNDFQTRFFISKARAWLPLPWMAGCCRHWVHPIGMSAHPAESKNSHFPLRHIMRRASSVLFPNVRATLMLTHTHTNTWIARVVQHAVRAPLFLRGWRFRQSRLTLFPCLRLKFTLTEAVMPPLSLPSPLPYLHQFCLLFLIHCFSDSIPPPPPPPLHRDHGMWLLRKFAGARRLRDLRAFCECVLGEGREHYSRRRRRFQAAF